MRGKAIRSKPEHPPAYVNWEKGKTAPVASQFQPVGRLPHSAPSVPVTRVDAQAAGIVERIARLGDGGIHEVDAVGDAQRRRGAAEVEDHMVGVACVEMGDDDPAPVVVRTDRGGDARHGLARADGVDIPGTAWLVSSLVP
jgi:hypothetical protein